MRCATCFRGLLLAVLAVLAAAPGSALADEPLEITIKGGFTLTDLFDFDGQPSWTRLSASRGGGFIVGPSFRIDLPGRFALQTEVLWVRRAVDLDLNYEVSCCGPRAIAIRTDHLEVPVLARFELGSGATRPYLLAGPSLLVKIDGQTTGSLFDYLALEEIASWIPGFAPVRPFERALRDVDGALSVGAGVDLGQPGPGGLILEMRASWGLRSLLDDSIDNPIAGLAAPRTRTIAVMTGYRF